MAMLSKVRMVFALAVALALVLPAGLAQAEEDDPAFLALSLGYFDVNEQEHDAVDFRLEYRHDERFWIFKPWAGIEVNHDLGAWAGGGVLMDIYFGRRFVVTPSFGIGAYHEGDSKDLGSVLEFRSQIEASYRFDDRSRLGLAFSHLSNASIGDDNPGVEVLSVYYAFPLDSLF